MFNERIPLFDKLYTVTSRDIFVMERAGTPFRKFSQKAASWNGIPEPLFHGIGITNTTLLHQILGHSLHSVILLKRKMALTTSNLGANSCLVIGHFIYFKHII
jgi:hypothetical protein